MSLFFINDTFFSKEDARISVLDLGLTRGFGVFDYLRTYARHPFHLEDHLARFFYSAKELNLEIPYTPRAVSQIIQQLIEKAPSGELNIKLFATGGESLDHFTPTAPATFIAFTYPITPYPPTYFTEGISAITTPLQRTLPTVKTTHYAPAILALRKGGALNPKEALYLNQKKEILEGTTSNFFAFKKGVLITPHSEELLLGITRELVLTLAKNNFPIEQRPIAYEEIPQFEESFITSSSREIMPVTQIDGMLINQGAVGPSTKKLQVLFNAYTDQGFWTPLLISRHKT